MKKRFKTILTTAPIAVVTAENFINPSVVNQVSLATPRRQTIPSKYVPLI
jgi:hypothetical protein